MILEALEIRAQSSEDVSYACIRYDEKGTDPIPVSGADDSLQDSKIEELFEITFERLHPSRGHRRRKSRWLACGQDHAITLARLRQTSGRWRVDGRFHRPAIS